MQHLTNTNVGFYTPQTVTRMKIFQLRFWTHKFCPPKRPKSTFFKRILFSSIPAVGEAQKRYRIG